MRDARPYPKLSPTSQTRSLSNTNAPALRTGADATGMTSLNPSATKPASGSRKPPKVKTCRVCKSKFQPTRAVQPTCDKFDCKLEYAVHVLAKEKAARERKEAMVHREAKAAAKPRSKWLKEAQSAFNRWVRLRDAGRPCISCGRHHEGQNHAGHFRSTGAAPELRFEESNVHLQCQPCNVHKSGNLIEYRKGLVERIGLEAVEWLEGSHPPKNYTIDDLRQIKARYMAMAKELA